MAEAWVRAEREQGRISLQAGGLWDIRHAAALDADLRALAVDSLSEQSGAAISLDLAAVERMDTAGAWLAYRTARDLRAGGVTVDVVNAAPAQQAMLETVEACDKPCEVEPQRVNPFVWLLAHLGRATTDALVEAREQLGFLGLTLSTMARVAIHPRRLRMTSLVFHMEKVGLDALPIVGLISILIGVVLAQQGAKQLQQFGAEIFVVDLIAVSVLREVGILLTAIVIAGRSGSAFTAEIGSMIVHEEVDAMRSLGLDPMELLVLPRVLALVLTLPMLAFFADLMGLTGGFLISWLVLDISPALFFDRLHAAIGTWHFWTGIMKAPVFAIIIAMVGCLEGLRVSRSAESVGRQTTRSVVTSIFLVIVVDAVFAVFFGTIGI